MESNVWTQLFVQAVNYLSSLFVHSNVALKLPSGGESPSVPASDVASTSTSKNATTQEQNVLYVTRDQTKATTAGVFGVMVFNNTQMGFTMERAAVAIPVGMYPARKELSPHFGFATPHLTVPGRTYIEIHPANYPSQLEGCIAVGSTIDGDSLDNSRVAFDAMMAVLPQEFIVVVS